LCSPTFLIFFWEKLFSLTSSSTWHDYIMLGCKRLTVFSYKIRIVYLLLIKIFPRVEFRFLSWIIMRYRTYISHYSSVYLTWSPCFCHLFYCFDIKFFLGFDQIDISSQISIYSMSSSVRFIVYIYLLTLYYI
jgi:hypothetical protein